MPNPLVYRRFAVISGHVAGDDRANLVNAPVRALENGNQADYEYTNSLGNYVLHAPPGQDVVVEALGFSGYDAPLTAASVDLGVLDFAHSQTAVNFTDLHWGTVEGDITDDARHRYRRRLR